MSYNLRKGATAHKCLFLAHGSASQRGLINLIFIITPLYASPAPPSSSSRYAYSNLNSDFILWHHPKKDEKRSSKTRYGEEQQQGEDKENTIYQTGSK